MRIQRSKSEFSLQSQALTIPTTAVAGSPVPAVVCCAVLDNSRGNRGFSPVRPADSGVGRNARNTPVEKNPRPWLHLTQGNLGLCEGNIACRIFSPCVGREPAMRTLSLQLIAATALLLFPGCQACFDSFNRFEAWKTEKCCNLFNCHRPAAPAVIYAPIAAPLVQQPCPQPVPIAAAPYAQPAPICAPIQCDPCANTASQVSSAPCCQQSAPCCPQPCCPPPCCPPVCCVNECCPSPCSTSYVSSSGCDSCCNGSTSGGVIVNEQPAYRDSGTIQNTPNLAPGPAAIGIGR